MLEHQPSVRIYWGFNFSLEFINRTSEHRSSDHVNKWVDDTVDKLENDNVVTEPLVQPVVASADTDHGDDSEGDVGHDDADHQQGDGGGSLLVLW